ncbi:MAG TPA: phosphatase PAP2 family protein [Thermoleophilaceae bacterium]|nr:phosphatase PAP2 family protein [Thermoleophilaceae bacterium]
MRVNRALRNAALLAVAAGVAAPMVRYRLKLRPVAVSALAWQAPFALAVARPRSPLRDAGIYALQMWAYIAHYEMPNDDPERLLARLRVNYPIRVDRAIGMGEEPTLRLQRAFGRPGEVQRHDLWLSWVHWSWFLVPHGSMAFILWRHRDHFPRSACLMAGTFDAGLAFYWLVPTAPPWWAGANGNMRPVRRIMVESGEHYWGRLWRPLYDFLGGNPFAAMPSLHFATSVMAAHVLTDVGPVHGAVAWTYAVTLGFALVYLGEHYVLDLAAGLTLAEAVRRLGPRLEPVIRAVQRHVQQLEPGTA